MKKTSAPLLLFSGSSNKKLAAKIASYLGVSLGDLDLGRFPDGEIRVKIRSDVRGADVYIIQSTCTPVNDHLMELLIMADALRRASAKRITAVIPYFGYSRQDRKDEGRVPITAKLTANMLQAAGIERVVTLDLHAAQIQGFFDVPVDHLYASRVFTKYARQLELPELVVASPDVGGMKMAWGYTKRLDARLAVIEKRRISGEEVEVGFVIGDIKDKDVILVDDIISTGGSISKAASLLKEKGARKVYVMATHAVFCGRAVEKLRDAPIAEIIVTDTIPVTARIERLRVLSVAELLGEALHRIHTNKSVSTLFR
ncbi:MAG TPA: ribose-phosphate diphosphokinase [Planctomycetes bacterium]|nr:ribose-phosphate diphosphokinase [Planctomycetota bacterium]